MEKILTAEKIIVVDRVPAFRRGLAAILEDGGFEVAEPDRPESWIQRNGAAGALVTVRAAADFQALEAICVGEPRLAVISVLAAPEAAGYQRSLQAGARAVVPMDVAPTAIIHALRSAMDGMTVLPAPVAQRLVRSSTAAARPSSLDPKEVRWLCQLARGTSVVQLARAERYSEREVYRRLSAIYRRLDVRNRQEAIALVGRWGFDPHGPGSNRTG